MEKLYIDNQEIYTDRFLGKYPLSYNGCGVIAIYNLMVCLGKHIPTLEIVKMFESMLWFQGKYGIMPWQMSKVIKICTGKKPKWYISKNPYFRIVTNWNNNGDYFIPHIIMYMMESGEAHYVFVDEKAEVHNSYDMTLHEICESTKFPLKIIFEISGNPIDNNKHIV